MRIFHRISGLWLVLLCLCLSGCASGRYGDIIMDGPTTKAFDTFAFDKDMAYYISGPDLFPNALVGLKKPYVIAPDTWKSVPSDPKVLRDIVLHMQERALEYGGLVHGFVMRTPDGRTLGVWYSIPLLKTFIKMGEGNTVIVYPPDLTTGFIEGGGGLNDPTSGP